MAFEIGTNGVGYVVEQPAPNTPGIALIRKNDDGTYYFRDEHGREDPRVSIQQHGSFRAWGIRGFVWYGGALIHWPGNSWLAATGSFTVQSNFKPARIEKTESNAFRFVDENGNQDTVQVQPGGSFSAFGIAGRVSRTGIAWPGNSWLWGQRKSGSSASLTVAQIQIFWPTEADAHDEVYFEINTKRVTENYGMNPVYFPSHSDIAVWKSDATLTTPGAKVPVNFRVKDYDDGFFTGKDDLIGEVYFTMENHNGELIPNMSPGDGATPLGGSLYHRSFRLKKSGDYAVTVRVDVA